MTLLASRCSTCFAAIAEDAAPVRVYVGAQQFGFCSFRCHRRWAEVCDLSKPDGGHRYAGAAGKAGHGGGVRARPAVVPPARPKLVVVGHRSAPKPPKPKMVRGSPEWEAMLAARGAKLRAAWARKSTAELAAHAEKIRRGRAGA